MALSTEKRNRDTMKMGFAVDRQTCFLWLMGILSLICAMFNGIDMSFNVYVTVLKETFNFTQTQGKQKKHL